MHHWFHNLSRRQKRFIIVPIDGLLVMISFWLALALRVGEWWPEPMLKSSWWVPLTLPFIGFGIFTAFGLYRVMLRSLGRHDMVTIGKATSLLTLVLSGIGYFDVNLFLPRSTPIIFGLVLFFAMVGARGAGRSYYYWLKERGAEKKPVVVYGAGESGIQLVSALDAAREFKPVAFLDDDRNLHGSLISGRRVFAPEQIDTVLSRFGVNDVLLALPSISRSRRREIVDLLSQRSVTVQTIPSMVELVGGFAAIDKLREVGIHELLERDPVGPISDLFSSVRGRIVMITGAGGSIGSELCRQIVAVGPAKIILYELSEYALYTIEQELRSIVGQSVEVEASLGSVCDELRLERVIVRHGVETIYHAAAYKHVPLVEDNPFEGIRNNTFGTLAVARIAERCGVARTILISTDKAVRPTNVMGASKRLAELIFQRAQSESSGTVFSMVRFGNVMGSSGSVIPLFQKQIAEGGPVTVTHPEVTRYFMTIPEAAQLVIQAGSMAQGGEVFILEMGTPVRILDLAKRMIRLSGLEIRDTENPGGDIEIIFSGLRPGEKLYEELLVRGDVMKTKHPKIMKSLDTPMWDGNFDRIIKNLKDAVVNEDFNLLITLLEDLVEDYVVSPEFKRNSIRGG